VRIWRRWRRGRASITSGCTLPHRVPLPGVYHPLEYKWEYGEYAEGEIRYLLVYTTNYRSISWCTPSPKEQESMSNSQKRRSSDHLLVYTTPIEYK
jgi:hypothetical protein